MSRFDSPLNNLKIASPCSADWDAMQGDERKRFCGECKLNVYDLSGMTAYDAENLLRNSEGRLCVRYFQRADGTVLTKNCPVGWAAFKRRTVVLATAAAALFVSFLSTIVVMAIFGRKTDIGKAIPIPFATPTPRPEPLMGAVAIPTPTPKATPAPKPDKIEMLGEVAPISIERKVKKAAGV